MPRYTKVIKKEAHSTTVGILSAGIGNKIKSYEPRSLIKVGSDSLLSYQINLINNLFTSPEIIVGVGVGASKIMKRGYPRDNVRLVENQNYSNTGSFETLRLLVNNCTTDTLLIMHGDLYFNTATLDSLVVNHIKEGVKANKTVADIVNSAKPVIESYLLQDV